MWREILCVQYVSYQTEVEGAWRRRGASCRCLYSNLTDTPGVLIHPLIEASDRVVEKFSASDEAWRFGTPKKILGKKG